MEAGEENSDVITNTTKRQRPPLSDSEDNLPSAQGVNDGQKRRRLEPTGQENRSPTPSSSGRAQELMIKLDTPIIPSVRSRVQQLTQRREGGAPLAQRCLSDPGADSPSVIGQDVFREHHLGEGEFHQRMERFKGPVCQTSPTPSQIANNQCPRSLSNVISGIQQKLQGSATPSSKQASRIRQEREQELKQLNFNPISENAWLKRSTSDPSLSEQVDGDNKITDGSFTETLSSGTQNLSVAATDVKPSTGKPCDFNGTAASFELEPSHDEQLQMGWEEQKTVQENRDDNLSHKNEEQQSLFAQTESQHLSISDGPNESEFPVSEQPSSHESTCSDVMNLEEVTDERGPVEEGDKNDESSYGEGEIEMSTDEEFRMWRYPQDKACREESIVFKKQELEPSLEDQEPTGSVVGHSEPDPVQDGEVVTVSCEASDIHTDLRPASKEDHFSSDGKSVNEQGRTRQQTASCKVDATQQNDKLEKEDMDQCPHEENGDQQSKQVQIMRTKEADGDLRCDERASGGTDPPQPKGEDSQSFTGIHGEDGTSSVTGVQTADHLELTEDNGETSKKVTFVLQPKLINAPSSSEINSVSDNELSSHDETNTAEIIDQMFDEVLEYAGQMEREQTTANDITEDHDSGIGCCSGDKDKMDSESDKEKRGEEQDPKDENCKERKTFEMSEDELLTFPPSGILSPLSKSVEAVVTPLRLAVSEDLPSLLLTPEETPTPLIESAPLYSVDAYRTQRLTKLPTVQRTAPGVQSAAPEKPQPQPSINTKEKIAALNEEAAKLQTVINQTLQALSCCTDEEHGRGSFEEAEAEKLLVVSCEKRSAMLAEVARLRGDRSSDSSGEDGDSVSQHPCRGTVSITNIQLPLKVEFVCSSHGRTGRPSHYFFVLIRYGPCNIVATPLATAADAQKGDTISFPTSVILKDIRSTFEIDVEVYSLSHTSGSNCSIERPTPRSRVTPRKLLNTITRSSNSLTSAAPSALNTRRSSNFCLVGSHKITLASLGLSKFPLDKMKLEGKIRRLLGDEFQEKVPFLSPLEGHIYLQLHSESRSYVQHQGFLTMFEMVSGFGSWRRRYFSLEGWTLYYWNQPNDKENKEAEGSISLSSSPSRCVRSVNRDSCARPFTFELVSTVPQQQNDEQGAAAKCWFSADTKQDKVDWIERLSQALLDFNTWNRTEAQQSSCSSSVSGNLRESIL